MEVLKLCGYDVEVFSWEWLKKPYENATGAEREHVTTYIRKHGKTHRVNAPGGESVNTLDDYMKICEKMKIRS